MCGIIGYVGPQGTDVTSILLEGLSKLEYRGYDSAGIAVLTSTGHLELHRRAGKIANLLKQLRMAPILILVLLGSAIHVGPHMVAQATTTRIHILIAADS